MDVTGRWEKGIEALVGSVEHLRKAPWLFIHIPKTAGTSFFSEAYRTNVRRLNVHVSADDWKSGENHFDILRRKLSGHANSLGAYQFIHGHFRYRDIKASLSNSQSHKIITFLRNPVERFISDYCYSSSDVHPGRKEFTQRYPTLDAYLADTGELNKLHKFLCEDEREDPMSVVRRMNSEFSFIGIQEMYLLSVRLFHRFDGARLRPGEAQNVTQNDRLDRAAFDGLRPQIRRKHDKDMIIYKFFSERLRSARDDLWAKLR